MKTSEPNPPALKLASEIEKQSSKITHTTLDVGKGSTQQNFKLSQDLINIYNGEKTREKDMKRRREEEKLQKAKEAFEEKRVKRAFKDVLDEEIASELVADEFFQGRMIERGMEEEDAFERPEKRRRKNYR